MCSAEHFRQTQTPGLVTMDVLRNTILDGLFISSSFLLLYSKITIQSPEGS